MVKKKKEKMTKESSDPEKGDATSSSAAEVATPVDTKETGSETETQVEEEPSVANEAPEVEAAAKDAAGKAAEPTDSDELKSSAEAPPAVNPMEVDVEQPAKSPEPVPSSSCKNDDPLASRLAKVVKTGSEPGADASSSLATAELAHVDSPALSTENLISMLEGSTDKDPSDTCADQSADGQPPESESAVSTSSQSAPDKPADLPPPKSNRKYIYKLRSKTGKVLKYVSSVPIVLKRPVISLTKMPDDEYDEAEETDDEPKAEGAGKARGDAEDAADSDNSTKENHVKANDASKGVLGPRIARKRGRPPLLQKTPVVTLDDSNSPDAASDPKSAVASGSSTPSYGVQTRKRQLKFMPDGRVVTPDGRVVTPVGKKYKSAAAAAAATASTSKAPESSDTDARTESDDGSQSERRGKKLPVATKKLTPVVGKVGEKRGPAKKVFDYESYFREKSATPTEAKPAAAKKVAETPKSTPVKTPSMQRTNAPVTGKVASTPTNNAAASGSTPASANKNTVDPAQLLSSLIGVPIFQHQLNVVKFKPKVIQDRKTMSAQKNVTFVDETPSKKSAAASQPQQQQRNASFRVSAKPSLQKILPKPISTPDRASTSIRKTVDTPRLVPSAASRLAVTSSKLNAALTSPITYGASSYRYGGAAGDAAKFENFTDTKVVKTKEGPKKEQRRKQEPAADHEVKTVYDLVQNVFEQLPSWNLHIIPDTNSFCIAQVSRGRMGIPILKKSIELNSEFAAKVYVHQLHCKKYDGIYDTESKILSLIREIDALAA